MIDSFQTFKSYGYFNRLEITNTLIKDKKGGNDGGGIVKDSETLIIANSTVANNKGDMKQEGFISDLVIIIHYCIIIL